MHHESPNGIKKCCGVSSIFFWICRQFPQKENFHFHAIIAGKPESFVKIMFMSICLKYLCNIFYINDLIIFRDKGYFRSSNPTLSCLGKQTKRKAKYFLLL
jgi:hypothetical protein